VRRAPGPARPIRLTEIPLRVRAVVRREFGRGTGHVGDPAVVRYFRDLAESRAVPARADVLTRPGNTFATMAAGLIEALPALGPVDLAVVAHATPDLDPRLSVATFLAEVLPGDPFVFAVSDHGTTAAFTALRLAGEHIRRHSLRRAVVMIMDQSTLPYEVPGGAPAAGDAAVAILLEDTGPAVSLRVGLVPDTSPAAVPGILRTAVSNPDIAAMVTAWELDPVARSRGGWPCTGIWTALAESPVAEPAVLVEYDDNRGELGLCVVGDKAEAS